MIRFVVVVLMTLTLATLLATPVLAEVAVGPAECWTYAKPDGESFFALSLSVEVDQADESPRQVVILVDTSASQIGYYRTKSLETLDELLNTLRDRDAVQLFATDVRAVPMTEGPVGPHSPEMKAALEKLKARTPLGASDVEEALDSALAAFDAEDPAPKRIVYIGDGLSSANLLPPNVLDKLIGRLVAAEVPVTGYALGARTDVHLFGVLAAHTGGVVAVDAVAMQARRFGQFLANAVRTEVFWPTAAEWPPQFVDTYPTRLPPLRTDRDSIIVGRGQLTEKFEVTLRVEDRKPGAARGLSKRLTWSVTPTPSDEAFSFLPELVGIARKNGGVTLPLAGRGGLVESRLSLNADLAKLIRLGSQALKIAAQVPDAGTVGSLLDQAETLARRALELDPASIEGEQLMTSIRNRWLELAKAGIKEERFDRAAQAVFRVLRIDPENAEAKRLANELPQAARQAAEVANPEVEDGQE
jgi:tetratricopeptide (TPR) repeat protein